MTPEQILMSKVKSECGEWIDAAVKNTTIPDSFLAALTANESGGDVAAVRFEPQVFANLALVLIGRRANFGSIGAQDLESLCAPSHDGGVPLTFAQSSLVLVNLASSWGPTQIMGYHALEGNYPLSDLPSLQKHYPRALQLLAAFRKQWGDKIPTWDDDPVAAATALFRCWNTGKPDGVTYDPLYVSHGLDRMTIYATL